MSATEAPLHHPRLGNEGDPCPSCGAPMASDQRYCLSCGTRRGDVRVPFMELLAPPAPAPRPVAAMPIARRSLLPQNPAVVGILSGIVAAAVLGLGLLAGALIAHKREPQVVAAATTTPAPAAVTPVATAAPAAATVAPESFTPDWPAGQEGWTIQLQTLPKDGTQPSAVNAAKAGAASKGAAGVGALDSDSFASLDAGNYVIYSGNFPSKSEADGALDGVKGSFPDAKVVKVSSTSGDDSGSGSDDEPAATPTPKPKTPEEAQQNTKKAPAKVETEGTPPPKDNKKPGAGTDSTTIG
jgi:hypothetical protein